MNNNRKHNNQTTARQGARVASAEPLKIGASTPFDFSARNLTAYGGLLPVATMLEKLGFQQLVEETLTIKRLTRAMPVWQFVLAMVLALYVGFSRLNHLRFLEREPMLTGILKVLRLPPQCTFWRFLASLHLSVAGQILRIQQMMRQRVWEAAHVELKTITLDTDTTVHTLFGHQMGGRKSYNPKNRGKKSFQPILTFLAETREYVGGELRNGDRPTGKQIARHLESVFVALPKGVETIYARADSGFYCNEAVEAYEKAGARYIVSARKTSRLIDELKGVPWTGSPKTDADAVRISISAGGLEPGASIHRSALHQEEAAARGGEARTISVVRHSGVQLPSLRNQFERRHRFSGVVLQPAGGRGEPHQGSQQRRRAGRPSVGAVADELHLLSARHAGLQPQLLADAVQSRRGGQGRAARPYHPGHGSVAVPVSGSAHLAPRGYRGCQLQRSLCGAAFIRAADGATAGGDGRRRGVCAGDRVGPPLLKGVHKILCTRGPTETITYKRRESAQAHHTSRKKQKPRSLRSQVRRSGRSPG